MSTNGDYPDTLTVRGIPAAEGEYPCNVVGMLMEGTPHTLTNREGHRVKVMTGVRAGELWSAMEAGDNDVLIALAAVVLARAGKRVNEELLWDAPMGSGLEFDIAEREGEADDDDPLQPLPMKSPEPDGGEISLSETSGLQENVLSPTGLRSSFPSDQETSEI